MQATPTVRPFLRWAGSKRSVVRHLELNTPSHYSRYLEPFVGSGALYFHLNPKSAILSDLNWEVVNLFHQVKKRPRELHRKLNELARDKDTYLRIRQHFGSEQDNLERATAMLYLNRNCFNGLYRTNKSGKFNVPYANQRRGEYLGMEELLECAHRLKRTKVIHGDFYDVITTEVKEGDFVYLDPPYVQSEGRIFHEYVKGHFNLKDTKRLADLLEEINSRRAYFLLTFIEDDAIAPIAQTWGYERYLVQRNISGFAANRRKCVELLIKNW